MCKVEDEKLAAATKAATSKQLLSDVIMKQSIEQDRMWYIHGVAYDLEEFVERHPGGVEAIRLGRGRDCTALFESYHAFSENSKHRAVLDRYRKQSRGAVAKSSSHPSKKDEFYEVLKARASDVLKQKGIDPNLDRGATPLRTAYYGMVLIAWIVSGYSYLTGSLLGSFLFALSGWFMGALGHDAGHYSASRNARLNEFGVWAMSSICNPILWQHQHTYGHHSFTNDFDHDPDLHHFDRLLRVHHRIQHDKVLHGNQSRWLYVVFAYVFTVFGTAFWIPWDMMVTGSLYGIVDWKDKDRPQQAIGMRAHFSVYVALIMVVPIFTFSSIPKALLAIYVHIATIGLTFAFFSQINHLNEPSIVRSLKSDNNIESKRHPIAVNSWAASQIETSNNFASNSWMWHLLSNGLNHQIEHHLFPGLNHCHLHHLAPVVQKSCEEFGVNYKSYDTWSELMAATLDWLNKLSVVANDEKKFC